MKTIAAIALCFLAGVLLACCAPHAKAQLWQPSPGHPQIAIWPSNAPDSEKPTTPEAATWTDKKSFVAGRPWLWVTNVSRPTITVYPPKDNNSGVAVVVFPGGGYLGLAIDLEGTEVCDWLTSSGITCVLLKYRVPYSGPHWDARCQCGIIPPSPLALEDAQRAIGLVRFNAARWHIDPHKVGVIGFSAGGHLAAAVSTNFQKRSYNAVDAADRQSSGPDFAIAIYPGHLWGGNNDLTLKNDIHVTKKTPPTFLLQAEDDNVDGVNQSLAYYIALKDAGVPVEMHLYAGGGHGFGLRRTTLPITTWPRLVEAWLRTIGMTST